MRLHRRIADIRAAGAELYLVGNGAPTFIAGFRDETGYAGPIYTDPSLATYRAAGLSRGLRSLVNVGAAVRGVGALARGYRQGRTQGDQLQQGGALVIAPDGSVRWRQVSRGPGDNADPADIVQVVARARR